MTRARRIRRSMICRRACIASASRDVLRATALIASIASSTAIRQQVTIANRNLRRCRAAMIWKRTRSKPGPLLPVPRAPCLPQPSAPKTTTLPQLAFAPPVSPRSPAVTPPVQRCAKNGLWARPRPWPRSAICGRRARPARSCSTRPAIGRAAPRPNRPPSRRSWWPRSNRRSSA